MSGANAGRTAAGAAGIVSWFVLAQIFIGLLLLAHPQPNPSLSAWYQPQGHSWKGGGVGGVGEGIILYICK